MNKLAAAISLTIALNQVGFANPSIHAFNMGDFDSAKPALRTLANKNKIAQYDYGTLSLYGYATELDREKAIANIKNAAAKGNLKAQLFMAKYYLNIKKESNNAFFWFKKAADKGNTSAMLYVAAAYQTGFGTKENERQYRRYIINAAKKGNAFAQTKLAKYFIKKRSYRSKKLGLAWLKKAAKQNYAPAFYQLAKYYGSSYSLNKSWLNKLKNINSAQSNYLAAKYYLAYQHQDIQSEGINYLKKSAAANYPPALYELGIQYQSNEVTQIDDQKAFKLIKKAAKLNYQPAQKHLASLYKNGIGVATSTKKSSYWLNKSKATSFASKKHQLLSWLAGNQPNQKINSQYALKGILSQWQSPNAIKTGAINHSPQTAKVTKFDFFKPTLTFAKPNNIKTFVLADLVKPELKSQSVELPAYPIKNKKPSSEQLHKIYSAALLGDRDAQFTIGQYHQYGIGVDKSLNGAAQWYFTAAKQRHLPSEYALGILFLTGQGVKQDFKKASYWLNRTAFKGNVEAQFALAQIYQHGYQSQDGTSNINQDSAQAKAMYHLASGAGNPLAKYHLANIYAKQPLSSFASDYDKKKYHRYIANLYEQAHHAGIKKAELPLAFYYVDDEANNENQQWAFEVLNKEKYSSNPKVKMLLGLMHERGLGTPKNIDKAIDLFKVAANANINSAKFMLGSYYYLGQGVDKDPQKAQTLLTEAANSNLAFANYNLAVIAKQNGLDYQHHLQKASSQGFAPATLYQADNAILNGNNFAMAAKAYLKLSQQDHELANLKLGFMHQHGLHFNKNLKKAYSYYLKSAKKNNATAQYQLGLFNQAGLLGKQKIQSANYWYKKAAKQKHYASMINLGFIAESNLHDYGMANKWYNSAMAVNTPVAWYNSALIYDYGKGQPEDNQKAQALYLKAANANLIEAKIALAKNHLETANSDQHYQKAFKLFSESANPKNGYIHYQLGKMHEAGLGTSINLDKAAQHYKTAAKAGYDKAVVSVARLQHHQSKQAEPNSLSSMFANYLKAANQGNNYAKYQVANFYLQGLGTDKSYPKGIKLLTDLSKKGFAPAKVMLKQIDMIKTSKLAHQKKQSLLKKKAEKEGLDYQPLPEPEIQLPKAADIVSIKHRSIEPHPMPNAMYLHAISELEKGNLYYSKEVLDKIIETHPQYLPAQKTVQLLNHHHQTLNEI